NDSLKALLSASLIRRLLPGRGVRFDSLCDFWIYLAITAFLVPALSAAGGAATWGVRGQGFWHTWRNWFLGNALVNIVLTPLFLELATDWRGFRKVTARHWIEAAVIIAGLVVAVWLLRSLSLGNTGVAAVYPYVPVAFLILAAVRFGPIGASGSLSIMSLLLVVAVQARRGPL